MKHERYEKYKTHNSNYYDEYYISPYYLLYLSKETEQQEIQLIEENVIAEVMEVVEQYIKNVINYVTNWKIYNSKLAKYDADLKIGKFRTEQEIKFNKPLKPLPTNKPINPLVIKVMFRNNLNGKASIFNLHYVTTDDNVIFSISGKTFCEYDGTNINEQICKCYYNSNQNYDSNISKNELRKELSNILFDKQII